MSAQVSARQQTHPAAPARRGSYTGPQAARRRTVFFSIVLRAFGIAIFLSMLPRLLIFFGMSTSLVGWRWQFDYDEGINLNATLQLASWHNIYHHNGPEGFISAPYSPLYYAINAPITWITGPQFASGRIISLLSTLIIALLLVHIVRQVTGVWGPGLVAGALWLSTSPVIVWSAFYKQDMPALALGLAGFVCSLSYALTAPSAEGSDKTIRVEKGRAEASRQHGHQYRSIYLAAIFFALSFWTKQSSISAAVAVALWLLLHERRTGIRLVALLMALVALPFVSANILLHGALWEHMVGYHAMSPERGRFDWMMRPLWAEYTPLFIWAGLALCGTLIASLYTAIRGGRGGRQQGWPIRAKMAGPWMPAILYALVGGDSTLVQSGYEGANFNHLLDAILPACLWAGLSAGWLWKKVEPRPLLSGDRRASPGKGASRRGGGELARSPTGALIGAALVCTIFAWQIASFKDPQGWFYNSWPNSGTDLQMRHLYDLVARTPGPIYSEDAYLLLSTGHQVTYDDASTFVPMAQLGRWDDSGLVEALRKRTIRLALLTHDSPRVTRRMREALRAGYSKQTYGSMDVYVAVAVAVDVAVATYP